MKVDDIESQRWQIALELSTEGHAVEFDRISFYLDRATYQIRIGVLSAWEIGNIDERIARPELARGEYLYKYLCANSKKFNDITKGFKPRFSLLSDYGNGIVEVCRLENDAIIWNS